MAKHPSRWQARALEESSISMQRVLMVSSGQQMELLKGA